MSSANAVLDSVENYIARAREKLAAGEELALSGMETEAARLAGEALKLPPDERRALAERIQRIMQELAALEQQLKERQHGVMMELGGMGELRRAHAAYLSAGGQSIPKPASGE